MGNVDDMPVSDGEGVERRGIFDCDDAYKTPTGTDFKRLFQSGMIVLDTNVLINLYRSNGGTRRDTFAVLRKLKSQIWVPHQVLSEFWRNRDLPSVKGHHRAKARTVCGAIDKAYRSLSDATDRWLADVHLEADDAARKRIGDYGEGIRNLLDGMKQFIEEQAENDALDGTDSTHTDPVLLQLEPMLFGRIGEPLTPQGHAEAVEEAKRRAQEGIPPGYADYEEKPDEQAAGDYIIWKQVIEEAKRIGRDVLLVTGDIKEDWWTPRTAQTAARPRAELRNELRSMAGVELFMLTPSQLLAEASSAFKLQVDERSVSDLASREGVAEIIPADICRVILESIEASHERAMAVHEVSGLKERSPYNVAISAALREELSDRVCAMGGTIVRAGVIEYPAIRNFVLVPHKSPVAGPSARLTSQRLRAVQELADPSQETLDFGDESSGNLVPVVIRYTASPNSGIESVVAGTGRFTGAGQFDFQSNVRLL
ncbi:PIN-like domain-containing protein [Streptomyces pseudogriseolus]|uniref:PIN-like domain-containing protein n=1 Tax=Streptomyces pseudogriseolus TaxID=36817 RepID=UPI00348413B4